MTLTVAAVVQHHTGLEQSAGREPKARPARTALFLLEKYFYLFTKVGPLAHPQGAKQGSWGPKQSAITAID
jgi:hypothetical protein